MHTGTTSLRHLGTKALSDLTVDLVAGPGEAAEVDVVEPANRLNVPRLVTFPIGCTRSRIRSPTRSAQPSPHTPAASPAANEISSTWWSSPTPRRSMRTNFGKPSDARLDSGAWTRSPPWTFHPGGEASTQLRPARFRPALNTRRSPTPKRSWRTSSRRILRSSDLSARSIQSRSPGVMHPQRRRPERAASQRNGSG